MRKLATTAKALDVGPPRRRPTLRSTLAVLLGLLAAPWIYELTLVCVANWHAMYGQVIHPETPLLDAGGSVLGNIARTLRERLHSTFQNLPWRPSLVIAIGILWAAFMSLPLRQRGA
jgi:hypothetical protein